MIPAKIFTVFRKDLKDVLRDRKTLIFMLLLPTLLMPMIMMGVSKFIQRTVEKREMQMVRVAIRTEGKEVFVRLVLERLLTGGPESIRAALSAVPPEAIEEMRQELCKLVPDDVSDLHELAAQTETDLPAGDRKIDPDSKNLIWSICKSEFVDPEEIPRLYGSGKAPPPESYPESVTGDEEILAYANAIASKKIQAVLVLPPGLEEVLRGGEAGVQAKIYFDSTIPLSKEAEGRLRGALEAIRDGIVGKRLAARGLSEGFVRPIEVARSNIAPRRKEMQAVLGRVLPYIIIIFSFLGAFYPALDLGAGEKERFTLETLLLSPASRFEIAAGKFLVILASSLVAALLGLTSMALTMTYGVLPEGFEVSFSTLSLVVSAILAIPVASVFASILLSVSIYARSFKEGQAYAAPLQILIILPALASLLPDIEISWRLAFIPLVNVSVVMREFMKGDYRWDFFAVTLLSTGLLAALAITFAAKWFNREQVIFRN